MTSKPEKRSKICSQRMSLKLKIVWLGMNALKTSTLVFSPLRFTTHQENPTKVCPTEVDLKKTWITIFISSVMAPRGLYLTPKRPSEFVFKSFCWERSDFFWIDRILKKLLFQLKMLIPELPSVKLETYWFTRSWKRLSNNFWEEEALIRIWTPLGGASQDKKLPHF